MNQTAIRNFKRDYHRCGRYNLHVQVPHLARLADLYKDKYEKTKHWTDCLKVGIFLDNMGFKILTNTCTNVSYYVSANHVFKIDASPLVLNTEEHENVSVLCFDSHFEQIINNLRANQQGTTDNLSHTCT